MQCAIQKYVDNSTSKTINCPKDITSDDLSKLLLEFIHDLKGITIYVDESKKGQVLNRLSVDEAKKIIKKNIETTQSQSEEDVSCAKGTCEI